jgi:hypothetical protein
VRVIGDALEDPEPISSRTETLHELLLTFQLDNFKPDRPRSSRGDVDNRFRINLNSIREYEKDLFSDLRLFWTDPVLSDFTSEQLAELGKELIWKYSPQTRAYRTAQEDLHRAEQDLHRAEQDFDRAEQDFDRAQQALAAVRAAMDDADRRMNEAKLDI